MNERLVKASAGVMLVGIIALCGSSIYNSLSDKKKDKERDSQRQDATTTQTIDTVVTSLPIDTASNKNTLDYSTLGQMSTPAKADSLIKTVAANAPIMYKGVEVDSLKEFPNAKLVGVSEYAIEFRYGTSEIMTYSAKGLLFELDKDMVSVIAPLNPFYLGQRYNISYHPFKKGIDVSSENVLNMFMSGEKPFHDVINSTISEEFDGVLVSSELVRKNQQVKK